MQTVHHDTPILRAWRLFAGVLAVSAVLALPQVAQAGGDPFGVYANVGTAPGQLLAAPQKDVSPLATALPTAWKDEPLSLMQLSALALHDNPRTRVAWETLRGQAAALGVAESAAWPTLNLNVPLTRVRSVNSAGTAQPAENTLQPNLSLSWLLWDFGQSQAAVNAAQAQLNAARFTQNATVQSILADVRQAYYQLLGDRALIESYGQALHSAQAALDAAQARLRAGQATIADVYQAKASVAAARATLLAAQQTVASDEGALANAVGLPLGTSLKLAPLDLKVSPKLRDSVQQLMQQALDVNPGLQSTRADVTAARAELRAAQRSGLPTLTLGATQSWTLRQHWAPTRQYSIGLTVSVPLFSGFKRHYQTAQARSALAEAQANLATDAQSTRLAVWQDYYAFRSASAALPSARAQLDNAKQALAAVQAQYRVGLATMQNLLAAQAALTSARVAVTRDAINSYQSLSNLSAAIGTLTPPQGGLDGR
ncbi:TolC family protein [Acidihalobacter ferrooxydans]|uniref:Protein CyaE n=1 Tax=Acidihalobacter ferrooxydans TaxID=1765967 RepID=A0A1P8ULE2_9GAMM|nr:TolC family protein [Acidihalobacter ferrooxydans]APZ44645.1 hypothetical protein BW247_09660 [Acidihalobacter ferrooxydans]